MRTTFTLVSILFLFISSMQAQVTTLVDGVSEPSGLIYESDSLYFTSFSDGVIYFKDLSNSSTNFKSIVTGFPFAYGVEKVDKLLYFGHDTGVSYVDVTDSDPVAVTLETGVPGGASGVKVYNEQLYYSNIDNGGIWRVNLTGDPNPVEIASGLENPTGIAVRDDVLYFSDILGDKVYSVDLLVEPFVKNVILETLAPNHLYIQEDTLYIGEFLSGTVSQVVLTETPVAKENVYEVAGQRITGVTVRDNKLVFSIFNESLIVEFCPESVTALQSNRLKELSVYPNPSTDYVIIETETQEVDYLLLNMHGQVVEKGTLNEGRLETSHLVTQPYFVYITSENTYARFTKI